MSSARIVTIAIVEVRRLGSVRMKDVGRAEIGAETYDTNLLYSGHEAIGVGVQQLSNANVPVLFRPMHEQNGNFFWWGHDGSSAGELRQRQAAWVAVWRKMVTNLTVDKGWSPIPE